MIELQADGSDIAYLLKTLQVLPKGLEKAASRAINKSLTATRAYMVSVVCEDYAVKAGSVRKELRIKKANWSTLTGRVHGAGSPGIPLKEFARTKAVPSTKRLKSGGYRPLVGIPVVVRKDKGKISAKGVFMARMASGHLGAFKRIAGVSARTGGAMIRETYGPSPIKILASNRYDERIDDFADDALQKNMRHEAEHVLRQMGLR